MLILPERNAPRGRLLMPMREWRVPSQAQRKDCFGNENRTKFSLTARLNDGHIAWRGWFDDREDADAFLFAAIVGSLRYERALWDLPTPVWRPGLGDHLSYEFVTTVFITSGATWPVPADCSGVSNQAGEFIDAIGAGGSGAASFTSTQALGAGGGAWSRIVTLALTPGGSVDIAVGVGGTAVTRTTAGGSNGNVGGDTWFNGANLAASSVGAKGGSAGATDASGAATGPSGGQAASGTGTTKNNGGDAGDIVGAGAGTNSTGGGGAGGPNGAGNNGSNTANNANSSATAGGAGDAGNEGTAGAANDSSSGSRLTATNGGNGDGYDASHGSGGGGGASNNSSTGGATGGSGGNYGGAGGGAFSALTSSAISGAGIQGLIVVAYVPRASFRFFNRAPRFISRRF